MPVNMSRGYSKVYSRKVNNVSQASIQFDKLFHENSNRPSAAKSAGTVGRWGVISCTSLRSTNINGRREETISNKRMRADYGSRSNQYSGSSKDPFSFDTEPDSMQNKLAAGEAKPVVKPRKFFKSRNADAPPEEIRLNASVYMGSNRGTESSYGSQGGRKYGGSSSAQSVGSKKFFTSNKIEASAQSIGDQTEAMNLSSPTKLVVPLREENKPPIVLRIFKGTSHLVNSLQVTSSVQQQTAKPPSESVSNSVIVRSSRRKHHVDTSSDSQTSAFQVVSKDKSSNSSITASPKKSNRDHKNREVPVEPIQVDSGFEPSESRAEQLESTASVCETESSVASPVASAELVCDKKEDVIEDASDDTGVVSESLPSSLSYPPTEDSEQFVEPKVVETAITNDQMDNTVTAVEIEPVLNSDLDSEDREKLLKAQELLSTTYVDFNSTAEKLLLLAPRPTSGSPPPDPPKTFLDHDWFSDSEGSNSISDHINTAIASSQGEPDAETEPEPEPEPRVAELEPEMEVDGVDAESMQQPPAGFSEHEAGQRTISPATRKGSIFKSRSLLSDGSKKRLALYKHKWADEKEPGGTQGSQITDGALTSTQSSSQPGASNTFSDMDEEFEPGKLTRVTSWPMAKSDLTEDQEAITSVKCNRKVKGFYTVVRNVKKAHQIQESGEFQEFNDDVEYILDALQDNNPIGTRCLSAITLASKCMAPAFRMHVRAHGTVAKFFRALHDATKDQSLGLCTATVMFVLSQDRLNMDLDRHSLELMLNLLESDASHRNALDDCGMSSTQLHKNKQKVRELCAEIQSQGHAKHLNLDNITVGHLAMETLLSLTSRRAGEWFKEELRELGGLEHIVKTICECFRQVDDYVVEWTDSLLDKLRKVDRCLRVLENVTHQNEENQLYLLKYGDGVLVDTLIKLFQQCDSEIPLYPVTDSTDKESTGVVIREALLAALKVLINLTHDFNNQSYGSTMVGQRAGIVDASLHLLLQVPAYVPEQNKFDLLVLALILLINLVEHSNANRKLLFEARAPLDPEHIFHQVEKSAVQALISLFYEQEEQARAEEVKTDAILDGKKDTEQPEAESATPKTQEEFIEETVAKLLQKAGRNMEHTLIGAYIGLLLGYLIIDNKEYEIEVRRCLPERNFQIIITVLQKVYNFMNLTASAVGSSRGIAQTDRVINFLIKSDSSYVTVEEAALELDLSLRSDVSMLENTLS